MKKQILSTLFLFTVASNAFATLLTFSDADSFGGLNGQGVPIGQTLTFGTSGATVSSSFNLVNPDGTSSFNIAAPYSGFFQGTYASALGFVPNANYFTSSANLILFFRDPGAGAEALTFTAGMFSFNQGSFATLLVISQDVTAQVFGDIDSTGGFNYSVSATSGSFILDAAYLEVEANAVPDGGSTVALLGSVLMAGACLRRKFGVA